jgi:hypothetical protein
MCKNTYSLLPPWRLSLTRDQDSNFGASPPDRSHGPRGKLPSGRTRRRRNGQAAAPGAVVPPVQPASCPDAPVSSGQETDRSATETTMPIPA